MYDQVLILPDCGVEFMQTVRMAALYSDKVHVYAPTKESTIAEVSDSLDQAEMFKELFEQFTQLSSSGAAIDKESFVTSKRDQFMPAAQTPPVRSLECGF